VREKSVACAPVSSAPPPPSRPFTRPGERPRQKQRKAHKSLRARRYHFPPRPPLPSSPQGPPLHLLRPLQACRLVQREREEEEEEEWGVRLRLREERFEGQKEEEGRQGGMGGCWMRWD
jgi:hypothetical protein